MGCSLFQEKEERFVNPLFYEPMISYPDKWVTRLSPTGYTVSRLGDSYYFPCYLVKNTEDVVVLNCETMAKGFQHTNPDVRDIHTFVLVLDDDPTYKMVKHTYRGERDLEEFSNYEPLEIKLSSPN